MDSILLLGSIALAPVAIIFTMVFMLDRFEREPLGILIISFILGIVIAVPVVFAELGMQRAFGLQDEDNPLLPTMLLAFVVVAFSEEGFKFLVLRLYAYPRKAFNEPYDGIMYAVAVSMGFAAIENVLYVQGGGIGVGILRMFTAVPAHAVFAHLMGYYMGLAKFAPTQGRRIFLMGLGLFLAVLAHGLYDFFLMYNGAAFGIFSFVLLLGALILAFKAILAHQRDSPFRKAGE